jgi:hypothetical protein
MLRRFLAALAGLAAAAAAFPAGARDYVVVASTDPGLTRGQDFEAGARVALAPGRTLTLMHASGDLVKVTGAAGGVVLPRRAANQAEADRLAILRMMVAPAGKQTVGAMRTRSGLCPGPEALTTLDAIVQAHAAGCRDSAAKALDAWLDSRTPEDA